MRMPESIRHLVDIGDSGCWIWKGATNQGGYGSVRRKGKTRNAHRVAYEECVGPILPGLDLDHLCRNRRCVNPAHLEPVTRRENLLRGAGTKLTQEAVDEIRERFTDWTGSARSFALHVAPEYGIAANTIRQVVGGRAWSPGNAISGEAA